MSSNVGLSTPRGSGTSGYVQRNLSLLKPRDSGYGAPYPPISATGANASGANSSGGFRQRKPDQQILDHDRKRAVEVKVLEERDRLEEENERIEEELKKSKRKNKNKEDKAEDGERDEDAESSPEPRVLTEEEIDERVDVYRQKLLKEMEDELAGRSAPSRSGRDYRKRPGDDGVPKARKQFKTYQVHELAEAKIEESERLRKALGIKAEGDEFKREPYDSRRDRF